jgi:hypothetical protein
MDRGNIHPVSHSTLSVIYSASKGVGALMLSMLIDQGLVDVDEPVSKCVSCTRCTFRAHHICVVKFHSQVLARVCSEWQGGHDCSGRRVTPRRSFFLR